MSNPGRKKASTAIYEQLKKKIIELELEPNEHLNEEQLSKTMKISRTPLREALHRLELEGLVTKQSTGKMIVARLTIEDAIELFKVREILQGLIAREAALRMDAAGLAQLEDKQRQMREAAAKGHIGDLVRCGREFHKLLYAPANNRTAVMLLDQLRSRMDRYRTLIGYKSAYFAPELPVMEHQRIYDAIAAKDQEAAEAAMRAHIRNSLERMKDTLQVLFPRSMK